MIVWLWVLLPLVLVALVMLYLSRLRRGIESYREQSRRDLADIMIVLRAVDKDLSRIIQEAANYSTSDPEPYGSTVGELRSSLDQTRRLYANQKEQYRRLLTPTYQAPKSAVARLLGSRREFRYYRERQETIATLKDSLQELECKKAETNKLLETLHEWPVTVASQAQELKRLIDDCLSIAEPLANAGLHGYELDQIRQQVRRLEDELRAVPAYFLRDYDSRLGRNADKKEVGIVWAICNGVGDAIDSPLRQLREWKDAYESVGQWLSAVLDRINEVEKSRKAQPELDFSDIQDKLEQAQETAEKLRKWYTALDIKDIDILNEQVRNLYGEIDKWGKEIKEAERQLKELKRLAAENRSLLDRIETQMMEAATGKYEVNWGRHQKTLAELNKLQTEIGRAKDKWKPNQLTEQLAAAYRVAQGANQLERQVTEACDKRKKLASHLDRAAGVVQAGWLAQVEMLQTEISTYDRSNWSSGLRAPNLLNDAQKLAGHYRHTVSALLNRPLTLQELYDPTLIRQINDLVSSLEAFQDRLGRLRSELDALHKNEQAALSTLEETHKAWERLTASSKKASVSCGKLQAAHKDLEGLFKSKHHKLKLNFENRQVGTIQGKIKDVEDWLRKCLKTIQPLPEAIQAEIFGVEQQLRQQVKTLRDTASFDGESAMTMAQEIIKTERPRSMPPSKKSDKDLAVQFVEGVKQVLAQVAEWEKLAVALHKLQTELVIPLGNKPKALDRLGEDADKKIKEFRRLAQAEAANWPPLRCDVQWLDGLAQRIKDEKEDIKSSRRLSDAQKYMARLTDCYRPIAGRVEEMTRQVTEDRSNLNLKLGRMAQWLQQLERYGTGHSEDRAVVEAVKDRINRIKKAEKNEKRWNQEPLKYAEATDILDRLWKQACEDLRLRGSNQKIPASEIEEFATQQ